MSDLSKNISADDELDVLTVYGIKISGALLRAFAEPTKPGRWFRVIKVENGTSTIQERADLWRMEEKPAAWLIERPQGTGAKQTVKQEVVLSPLTDDTFMDEGDEAFPLFRRSHD